MKRNYQIDKTAQVNVQDLIKQIAFHEAGHAAGIYLCNKQNGKRKDTKRAIVQVAAGDRIDIFGGPVS